MKRQDWIERLWATLEALDERPFYYGACVQLAAECVDAMTGSDFVQTVAPLIEAQRTPIALEDLERFVVRFAGEPIALNCADRGDVVLLDLTLCFRDSGPALGICTGPRIACAALPKGVAYLKRERALKAWRIA